MTSELADDAIGWMDSRKSMTVKYETDVAAWANEQARLIRAGQFDQLDLEHIAEEIEDVGKSEQRELASRMVVLLMHLLKWQYQPSRQSKSWLHTLRTQRKEVAYVLNEAPSLRNKFKDKAWLDIVWARACSVAEHETGLDLDTFPETCPWLMDDALKEDWLPDSVESGDDVEVPGR